MTQTPKTDTSKNGASPAMWAACRVMGLIGYGIKPSIGAAKYICALAGATREWKTVGELMADTKKIVDTCPKPVCGAASQPSATKGIDDMFKHLITKCGHSRSELGNAASVRAEIVGWIPKIKSVKDSKDK